MDFSKNNGERLLFWHFFVRIEKELSYERWIDKYRLFITALVQGAVPLEDDWASFKRFCKILYLQDSRHETRFEEILNDAIKEEEDILIRLIESATPIEKPKIPIKGGKKPPPPPPVTGGNNPPPPDIKPAIVKEPDLTEKYFRPKFRDQNREGEVNGNDSNNDNKQSTDRFLHTDEYFPMSRRDMAKSWQYLRKTERKGFGNRLNIKETVREVAKNGLFLYPVFEQKVINRPDTVLILADCRGSMTPFHELTKRLIETAREDGGHDKASVFYFQNYPLSNVYRQANLSDALKLKEALLKANRHITLAIIISDGGAARGNTDPKMVKNRVDMTQNFIDILNEHVAHILWLNPMPKHRWAETAAEEIADKVDAMIPVLDSDIANFQDNFRWILKQYRAK